MNKHFFSRLLTILVVVGMLCTMSFALSYYNDDVTYEVTTSDVLTTGTPSSATAQSNGSGNFTIYAGDTSYNEVASNTGTVGSRVYATDFMVPATGAVYFEATSQQKLLSVDDISIQVVQNSLDNLYYLQIYFTGDAAGIPSNEKYGYVDIYLTYYFSTDNGSTWNSQKLITSVSVYPAVATTYTVTYTDGVEDDVVFADQISTVEEGSDTPTFTGSTQRDGYTFVGWDAEIATTVTKNVTYTAIWEEDITYYTVSFVQNLDDEAIDNFPENMDDTTANETIILADPTHESTDNWTYYVFTGWVDENENLCDTTYTVTGNATLTATWEKITVNGDELWDYLDAMMIMDALGGLVSDTYVETLADRNNDGNVDYLDAMTIMDHMAEGL